MKNVESINNVWWKPPFSNLKKICEQFIKYMEKSLHDIM
jgi:hypothetical protein